MARPPAGIKRKRGTDDITIPDFELAPDAVPGIAQVIVDIWTGTPCLDKILDREPTGAKKGMATGFAVTKPQRQSMRRHRITIFCGA